MKTTAILTILAFALNAILLSWFYFRRYRVNRPPIGVLNRHDIAFMIGAIILIPYLYLWLPQWLVVGLPIYTSVKPISTAYRDPLLNRNS